MKTKTTIDLQHLLDTCNTRLQQTYAFYLKDVPSLELKTAMEYSLLNGGKHLRPLLIYTTGLMLGAPLAYLDRPACAVELIHTYSLIHDDLPCMDNADLRRGKPTLHKVYSEGMAVLAGDALHTLAMHMMASHHFDLKAERRIEMMRILSRACGPFGMAAGQAMDITVMHEDAISENLLTEIYQLKTGALFSACIELGRLASNDDDEVNKRALKHFGELIGLAFQIQDDIMDIEGSTALMGKQQGIDAANKKNTYPHLIGLEKAKEKVESLYEQALESINYFGDSAQILRDLAAYMLQRK